MAQILYAQTDDFHIEKKTSKDPMAVMHYHHAYELYYLVRGEREYFIGDEFYKLEEGDVVLIPPTLLHRTAGKGATRFLVYFSEEFLKRYFTPEMISSLPLDRVLVLRPDASSRELLERDLNLMLDEFNKDTDNPDINSPLFASYLCSMLFSISHAQNNYVTDSYTDGRVGQIIRFINEHYSEVNDIKQIAEHFFISKYHLCRIFNKSLGLPLISYLNTIKIRAAAELMHNEKLNLTDIATRCGFNSPSYFCKVFKAEKGVSPSVYRKQLHNK